MSFELILQDLVDSVPKAIGAILVDWEGEAVMEHCHCDPYELRFIAAHKGIILAHLKEMQSAAQIGEVVDVLVTSDAGYLIIGCIDKDYSLVMNLERDCNVGFAMYHFRRSIADLKKEMI
ncbi:MAG: roadblock/LC7 domain-containing protein [Desulfuromonadaceae bacterium]|nr:roadblock/LC7 domain-containing protein [Desulfuromonadaceae bacterium]MDD2855493.1 roadblock/LC7 domain-containing protein [Desulfuromonadaceae bacterium]